MLVILKGSERFGTSLLNLMAASVKFFRSFSKLFFCSLSLAFSFCSRSFSSHKSDSCKMAVSVVTSCDAKLSWQPKRKTKWTSNFVERKYKFIFIRNFFHILHFTCISCSCWCTMSLYLSTCLFNTSSSFWVAGLGVFGDSTLDELTSGKEHFWVLSSCRNKSTYTIHFIYFRIRSKFNCLISHTFGISGFRLIWRLQKTLYDL